MIKIQASRCLRLVQAGTIDKNSITKELSDETGVTLTKPWISKQKDHVLFYLSLEDFDTALEALTKSRGKPTHDTDPGNRMERFIWRKGKNVLSLDIDDNAKKPTQKYCLSYMNF